MLGLSTRDEPLRAWVDKTSEAAGVRAGPGQRVPSFIRQPADTAAVLS
jgi:hypothetical protein